MQITDKKVLSEETGGTGMDGRDWGTFLLPYDQAVEELKVKFKTMRAELKKREEYAPIEFVTGRVKKYQASSIRQRDYRFLLINWRRESRILQAFALCVNL